MLETFRKHHYVLMCLIAVVVIISFTFFFNPNTNYGGRAGSGAVVRTLFGSDLTQGEMDLIEQQKTVAGQISSGEDSVGGFLTAMHTIVDEGVSMDRRVADIDYATNVFVMRHEAERLGVAVEKEDIEKRIRELEAFRTNGAFDGGKLEQFLTGGQHGDRSATEAKLISAVSDVMLFERLAELVGGTYAPSPQEINADFAHDHESVTAATALIPKKDHENQTVTDEQIQKFYDDEKAKDTGADPIVLTEEKRTVKYCLTEAPKGPQNPPPPPQAPPALGAKPNFDSLPEDQKKAKEEEWKKREEEYKTKQDAYNAAMAGHAKRMEEYNNKVKEAADDKQVWLKKVSDLSNVIVSEEDRAGRTFEELAKAIEPPPPPPAPPAPPVPPVPPVNPAPDAPKPADGATPPAPAPVPDAPKPPAPAPVENPAPPAAPGDPPKPPSEQPNAVQGAQGPAGTEGQPSTPPATPAPAEPAPAPADPPAPPVAPAEGIPVPAANPAPPAEAPAPSVVPAPPSVPLPFVRTATFTKADLPVELKPFTSSQSDLATIIFAAAKGEKESLVEGSGQNAYVFFQVLDIQKAGVRPLEEVKQKITDKLKADKVTAALKAAADDARSKILEELKAGKSFKEAAETNKATVTELPAFSSKTPLPPATANAQIITSAAGVAPEQGAPPPPAGIVQPGDVSQPLEVPEGLLMVHVQKKELQKFPDTEEKKKELREKRTFHAAVPSVKQPQWSGNFEAYMAQQKEFQKHAEYFQRFGRAPLNPVFKAWFADRRNEAQKAAP